MKSIARFDGLCLRALLSCLVAGNTRAGTVLMTKAGPGGHEYELVADPSMTWSGAAADARAKGRFLATIGDADRAVLRAGAADRRQGPERVVLVRASGDLDRRGLPQRRAPPAPDVHPLARRGEGADDIGGDENSGSILWSKAGDPTIARAGFWNDLPDRGGYPRVAAIYPDLTSRGYLVEFNGTGAGFENGDGDGRPSVVPLPAAVWLFPAGACSPPPAVALSPGHGLDVRPTDRGGGSVKGIRRLTVRRSFKEFMVLESLAGSSWAGSPVHRQHLDQQAGGGTGDGHALGILGALVGGWLFNMFGAAGVTGFNLWPRSSRAIRRTQWWCW